MAKVTWKRGAGVSILYCMVFTVPRSWIAFPIVRRFFAIILLLAVMAATAEPPTLHRKATELLVAQYEKLIAEGALLTPEGWKRASKLFNKSMPYPKEGEILVVSTGGLLAEDWANGDRAQVETKWNDYYGKIDANLRYTAPTPDRTPLIIFQVFSLCKEPALEQKGSTNAATSWEWKIEGPLPVRRATVAWAIKYVADMRDRSHDPVVRKNANETIAALKRVSRGCGSASAC